jgi:hypothetical protein
MKQQLSEELKRMQRLANINEAADQKMQDIALKFSNTAPNTPPGAKAGETPKTSDVNNLTKLMTANTSLLNRLKTVNNNNEVIEFLTYILNTINPKVTGVNRSALKKIIDDRFTQ